MKGVQCEVRSLSFDDLDIKVKREAHGWRQNGYASIFNTKDWYRDIIRPKSFKKTIRERKNRIRVLWQHDADFPMGKPDKMAEDQKGLYTESFFPDIRVNEDRIEAIENGLVDALSVGFIPDEYRYIEDPDGEPGEDEDDFFFFPVREITGITLLEYSFVTIPGHDDARLVSDQKKFAIQHVLQKSGRSDLAKMVTGSSLKDVSPDLIEEMLGYLGAIYKSRTGTDYEMPVLTPDEIRSAALTWKTTGGLYTPTEKASVTVQVDVDEGTQGPTDPPVEQTPTPEGETETPQDEGETPEPDEAQIEERDLDNLDNLMAALNDLEVVPRGQRTEEKDLAKLLEELERIGD